MAETVERERPLRPGVVTAEAPAPLTGRAVGPSPFPDAAARHWLLSSIVWLTVVDLFGLVLATEFVTPEAFGGYSWLSFSRVRPSHVNGVILAWLTMMLLALTYYIVPRVTNTPLYSYTLSLVSFWGMAFFYTGVGDHHILQSPTPAWLKTIAEVSSWMLLVPVFAFTIHVMGVIDYIVAQIYQKPLFSRSLSEWQYWLVTVGFTGFFSVLTLAGFQQGFSWQDGIPEVNVLPQLHAYYIARGIFGAMIVVSGVIQIVNIGLTIFTNTAERRRRETLQVAEAIAPPPVAG